MTHNKLITVLLIALLLASFGTIQSQSNPKREFRGAWIHVIGQSQYANMTAEEIKTYLTKSLDELQAQGLNAIIFQVRPCADALYMSDIEPWSRYLTGIQGEAPEHNFDPMEFMIRECHERSMEFHAWLNPYRVTASENDVLHSSHVYHDNKEWFVKYGKQIYFDPGVPASKNHIKKIVRDIVSRYDIDAIHMDDYFYPYPIAGQAFPDDISFLRYAKVQGFSSEQRDDWRRNNVNQLVKEIKETIVSVKPWVRFGISPFGIYRNAQSTPDKSGSKTNGLQNYDDLYADVKLWVEREWIDYNIPQIYWEIGHKAADYETLIKWWSRNNYGAHLYIGQDVGRTAKARDTKNPKRNQLTQKMELERSLPAVYGNCFWPAYALIKNTGSIGDSLKANYHKTPALIPPYLHMHHKQPKEIKDLKTSWTDRGYLLHWKRNGEVTKPENAQYFVVYRFKKNENKNLDDASKIVEITNKTSYTLPYNGGKEKFNYVVTSVDRFHNESKKGKQKTIKL